MPSRGSVKKQLHSLISRLHSCAVVIEADPDADVDVEYSPSLR